MYINQFISKIDLYLEGQSEGLVSRSGRENNRVEGLKEGGAVDLAFLALNSPPLVPAHVGTGLQHVVSATGLYPTKNKNSTMIYFFS